MYSNLFARFCAQMRGRSATNVPFIKARQLQTNEFTERFVLVFKVPEEMVVSGVDVLQSVIDLPQLFTISSRHIFAANNISVLPVDRSISGAGYHFRIASTERR